MPSSSFSDVATTSSADIRTQDFVRENATATDTVTPTAPHDSLTEAGTTTRDTTASNAGNISNGRYVR